MAAFSAEDRALLTNLHGVGNTVVDRFEQIGIHTLQDLAASDCEHIVTLVSDMLGSRCWKNTIARRAVQACIDAAQAHVSSDTQA